MASFVSITPVSSINNDAPLYNHSNHSIISNEGDVSEDTEHSVEDLVFSNSLGSEIPFAFRKETKGIANMTYEEMLGLRNSPDLYGIPLAYKNYSDRLTHEEIFYPRIEPNNDIVRKTAIKNIEPGIFSIAQIVDIYDYLVDGRNQINSLDDVKGWGYISDPPDSSNYMFANATLESGAEIGCSGYGDCDDFAIVIASLVGAIGGSTRIVVVQDENGGFVHAYSEVYLGILDESDDDIYYLIDIIMRRCDIDRVYAHLDPSSKKIWLNLDARMDLGEDTYPGCPFRSGGAHYVIGPMGDSMREVSDLGYRRLQQMLGENELNDSERITIRELVGLSMMSDSLES